MLKKHLKYNEKEINIDALTIYHDGEVKVDIDMSSTFQVAKYVKVRSAFCLPNIHFMF